MKQLILIFLLANLNFFPFEKQITVGIQPFAGFEKNLNDTLSKTIKKIYGFNVKVFQEIKLPPNAYSNIKSPRYRADSLLHFLRKSKSPTVDYVIGLTNKDIAITKRDRLGNIKKPEWKYSDWGIFGLGYCPGPSCVVSTFRLKKTSQENFVLRFKKVCIHELGHNLGLPHCPTPGCVMNDANETIKTIDNELLELCRSCKMKLQKMN